LIDSAGGVWVGNAAGLWKARGNHLVHIAPGSSPCLAFRAVWHFAPFGIWRRYCPALFV
jgi:hypothetical protein